MGHAIHTHTHTKYHWERGSTLCPAGCVTQVIVVQDFGPGCNNVGQDLPCAEMNMAAPAFISIRNYARSPPGGHEFNHVI